MMFLMCRPLGKCGVRWRKVVLCGDARYLPGQVGIAFCCLTVSCVSAFGGQTVGILVFFFFPGRSTVWTEGDYWGGCCVGSFHFGNNRNEAVPYLYDSSGTTRKVAPNPYIFPRLRMP